MYCPSCGNEINVELKYCNRCGANLSQTMQPRSSTPIVVRLTGPTIAMGVTTVFSIMAVFMGVTSLAERGVPPVALVWIVLFAMATLFGCLGLFIRFWSKVLSYQRETQPYEQPQPRTHPSPPPQLSPRLEPVPSVTENTTRTFSPAYRKTDPI